MDFKDYYKIRFDQDCGIGVKPVSKEGTKRLARKALQYVVDNDRESLSSSSLMMLSSSRVAVPMRLRSCAAARRCAYVSIGGASCSSRYAAHSAALSRIAVDVGAC